MADLTAMSDDEFMTLRQDVQVEAVRRDRINNAPRTIEEVTRQAIVDGADADMLRRAVESGLEPDAATEG